MSSFMNFIEILACSPSSQLCPEYAKECAIFISTGQISEIDFLISLRHKCVYNGESSDLVVHFLSAKLSEYDQDLVKKIELKQAKQEPASRLCSVDIDNPHRNHRQTSH